MSFFYAEENPDRITDAQLGLSDLLNPEPQSTPVRYPRVSDQPAPSTHATSRANLSPADTGQPRKHESIPVVMSKVDSRSDIGTGFGFRLWTYLKFFITPDIGTGVQTDVCGDTGCSRTLGDRAWIERHYPKLEIRRRAQPLTVRGIGSDYHQSSDYVVLPFRFKGTTLDGKSAYAAFDREVALVSGLQANILIGMDVLGPERIDILNSKGTATVHSCDISIPMSAGQRGKKVSVKVRSDKHVTIPVRAYHALTVSPRAPKDGQDLMFDPAPHNKFGSFALLTDHNCNQIIVRNDSDKSVTIPRNAVFGILQS